MESSAQNFIPILFKVLFGFVGLNMLINLILLYTRPLRINKLLAIFWPAVLLMYFIQGLFQHNHLSIVLAYGTSFFTVFIMIAISFEAVNRQVPWRNYLLMIPPTFGLTFWLNDQGVSFTTLALPMAIGIAIPLVHSFIYLNIVDRKKTTRLQKFLGIVYLLQSFHSINFALFRVEPGAQLWGWLVSYALCDLLAILLPSITLEMYSLTENERLKKRIDERTMDLNRSLKTNENLLRVLIHDISNPLTVMGSYLHLSEQKRILPDELVGKLKKSHHNMESIIGEVKDLYLHRDSRLALKPTSLPDCIQEASFIFEQSLQKKNIKLQFINQLTPEDKVMADHTSLTHSVISNLISNGIKFTPPNSRLRITTKAVAGKIVMEIQDEGPGIPEDVISNVFNQQESASTLGTSGELGSGLGLSIVKSFVDSYGGKLHIVNQDQGARVSITLERA